MKKIEAKTLEEAYAEAAKAFDCSVTDLEYEIVQHPSKGFLGLGVKKCIIVATCKTNKTPTSTTVQPSQVKPSPDAVAKEKQKETHAPTRDQDNTPIDRPRNTIEEISGSEAAILDGFFDGDKDKVSQNTGAKSKQTSGVSSAYSEKELGEHIEKELGVLIHSACFDIDIVEVDVMDGIAYIFIDGEDAALLIGKEGYRYNALSYLLYNWIHNEFDLFIKLEIAQFLASQQEMIRNYIQPVIEHVHQNGWGKTRPLDGILSQIALEQLREEFPNKYVAIKRTKAGERYILINEFNKRS